MDNLIYAGFVLAGGVTLLIEAFRNFNAPGNAHPFALHPILKTVEIRNLTTPGEAMVGFAIYAAFYLVVYAVVLGSAEILQLVLKAGQSTHEVGAIGTALEPGGDPFALSGSGYEKPLLVSAALIAFLSIGAVRPVEATLRGVAHSLAGIPRGVYKVITELQNFNFEVHSRGYPTPLASSFSAKARALVDSDDVYNSLRAEVTQALTAIDCLTEATSPSRARLYFPLFQLETLTELSKTLDAQVTELGAAIEAMPERAAKEPPGAILQSVAQLVAAARQNTMAVFAVHYVRNNRSVFVSGRPLRRSVPQRSGAAGPIDPMPTDPTPPDLMPIDPMPIEAVRLAIARRYNAELNSFTFAIVLSTVIGAAVTFWVYQAWLDRNAYSEAPMSELSWIVCDDIDFDQKVRTWTDAGFEKRNSISCPGDTPAERFTTPDHAAAFLRKLRPSLASLTFFDTLRSTLLVLCCVFFVLIGRESRIDDQSWPQGWSLRQLPFMTLFGMSFFPGLIAVVTVACTELLGMGFYTGWQLKSAQVTELFLTNWAYFAMQFGTGLILGFGALTIMDKHNSAGWRWFVTAAVSLLFAFLIAGWAWTILYFTESSSASFFEVQRGQNFSQHWRDTLIFSIVPVLFFLLFALLLELSEAGPLLADPAAES